MSESIDWAVPREGSRWIEVEVYRIPSVDTARNSSEQGGLQTRERHGEGKDGLNDPRIKASG